MDSTSAQTVMRLREVSRDFFDGKQLRRVLSDITIDFYRGELSIISGPSGSGKTTMLTIMALILKPSEGSVYLRGEEITGNSADELATLRFRYYGFVFQNAALIPALSVEENVLMAAAVQGKKVPKATKNRAVEIIQRLGLAEFSEIKTERLSGGQKQRVAIARALVNDPLMVLCDEPTSALDIESSEIVLATLKDLSREGRAVVLVTHDPRVFPNADRLIQIEDGLIKSDTGTTIET